MAQTGFTPLSLYYSATAAATPTAGNLVAGELAINTNDGKLFYKDSSGVVQTIATKATAALPTTTTGSGNIVLSTSPTLVTPALGTPSAIVLTNATGLGYGAMPAGSVLQVVNATTTTIATVSNATFVDTTLTATITPKFATSKILVLVSQNGLKRLASGSSGDDIGIRLLRSATEIARPAQFATYTGATANQYGFSCSLSYLDSPATTSATIYKTQIANPDGSSAVYTQGNNENSTITLMEIAA